MADKNLFIYITKSAGHSVAEAAAAMKLSGPSLSKRLNGQVPFRASEIEAWMAFVGVMDAGPVFFPDCVARAQLISGGLDG